MSQPLAAAFSLACARPCKHQQAVKPGLQAKVDLIKSSTRSGELAQST